MVDYRLIYDKLKTVPKDAWVGILAVALKNSVPENKLSEVVQEAIYEVEDMNALDRSPQGLLIRLDVPIVELTQGFKFTEESLEE